MFEIFRDPAWQFIGALLAIIAIGILIVVYSKQRKVKSLSYLISSQTPLLSVSESIRNDLQISYKNKPIEQIHLIVIKVQNSGNTPMRSSDFIRPISVDLGIETNVISAEVATTEPENLQATIRIQESKVVVEPLLLNGGDSLTLKMLASRFTGDISFDARIVGVKDFKVLKKPSSSLTIAGLCIMLFGFLIMPLSINMFQTGTYILLYIGSMLGAVGIFLNIISILRHKEKNEDQPK